MNNKKICPSCQISVVIPTHGQDFLDYTLSSLCVQNNNPKFEVIVVENGYQSKTTRDCVNQYQHQLDIRYLYHSQANLNAARNLGIKAALSPIIALLDDDCEADPKWIQAISNAYKSFPESDIIGGSAKLKFQSEPQYWVTHQFKQALSAIHWDTRARDLKDDEWLVGSNLTIKKELFMKIGDFDASLGMRGRQLPQRCGDELEFCLRYAKQTGKKPIFDPSIQITHIIPPSRPTIHYFEGRFYGQGLSSVELTMKLQKNRSEQSLFRKLVAQVLTHQNINQISAHAQSLSSPDDLVYLEKSARCLFRQLEGIVHGLIQKFPSGNLVKLIANCEGISANSYGQTWEGILNLTVEESDQISFEKILSTLETTSIDARYSID